METVVHFGNCGAALPPTAVVNAQIEHLRLERDVGGYEAAEHNRDRRTFHTAVARLLGCEAGEIAFTDSASRAYNLFLHSLDLHPGDEILTSRIEFGDGVRSLRRVAARTGATLRVVASAPDGTVDPDDLARCLTERTKLVAMTHAAGHFGGVNPAEEIGRLVSGTDAMFLLDACQSVGQMAVDVRALACDALAASGRKWLRGPRGTGFLYVRESAGGAGRFERWERNVAAEIGLAVAVEYLLDIGVEAAGDRILALTGQILGRLGEMRSVSLLAAEPVRSGVIGFTVPGPAGAADELRAYLRERGVNVSAMQCEDAPLDCEARGIDAMVRIAPHYYNTPDEVEVLCDLLATGLRAAAA